MPVRRDCAADGRARHRGTPKGFGVNPCDLWIGDELCDERGIVALPLRRLRRRGDEKRHSLEPSCQVREPPQRRDVRPVQVVDRKQRRLVKGRWPRASRGRARWRRSPPPARSCDSASCEAPNSGSTSAAGPESSPRGAPSRGHKRRLEELADDPIRKLALKLTAARGEYAHPRRARNRAPSASSRVLPMPALPSTTTKRPPPPAPPRPAPQMPRLGPRVPGARFRP